MLVDVYSAQDFRYLRPDEKSVEATGNEGTNVELQYHRAAVVLIPKSKLIEVIAKGEEADVAKYLQSLVAKCSAIESREAPEWKNCKELAKAFLENSKVDLSPTFLDTLRELDDVDLLQKHLTNFYVKYTFSDEIEQFSLVMNQCLLRFGWEKLATSVQALAKGTDSLITNFY